MIKSTNLSFGNAPTLYRTMATDQMDLQAPPQGDRGVQLEKNRQLKVRVVSHLHARAGFCDCRTAEFDPRAKGVQAYLVHFILFPADGRKGRTFDIEVCVRCKMRFVDGLPLREPTNSTTALCSSSRAHCRDIEPYVCVHPQIFVNRWPSLARTSSLVKRKWTTQQITRWDSSTIRKRFDI